MKRTAVLLVSVCLATTLFAADTQRYLIGTKKPARAGAIAALRATVDVEPRNVASFESFDGFAAELTSEEALALRNSGEVRWIEPVVERNAYLNQRNPTKQAVPYGISQVGATAAHQTRKSGDVNVVVIDTGIDYNHAELKAIWMGGFNALDGTDAVMDDNGHGTHVAGTIAAADNAAGVLGVAPNVRLWAVKMLDASGKGTSEGLIKSIDWVSAQKDARGGNWVVNMSLGSEKESIGEREAFQRAADRGILMFGAAGNASTPGNPAPIGFPAALPSVAAVGAIDNARNVAYFSCQGPDLELAAPGVSILSTLPVGSDSVAYALVGSDFYPALPITGSRMGAIDGDFVHCGLGKPEQIPASVKGKIALIQRGELKFAEKARNAIAAGAVAVAIYNNDGSTTTSWTLISDAAGQNFDWPVVLRLEKEDGEKLAALGSGTMKLGWQADDYGHKSGTSMACPHAAGAAALLWTLAPNATATQVLETLKATALDLGDAGQDVVFGAGAIDVFAAAKRLAPEAFSGITTGRPLGKRNGRR